jgi:hypothetical protein
MNIEEIQQADYGRQSLIFGSPNSDSMYNERNSKGFDRTYQAISRESPGLVQAITSLIIPHSCTHLFLGLILVWLDSKIQDTHLL